MSEMSDWLASLSLEDRDYALKHLPSHMAEANNVGKKELLYRFLTDFDFIAAKALHPEIKLQELIEDYDRAFDPPVLIAGEKAETLKLIQAALRVSAHILEKDKTQLAGQLLGRLLDFSNPEIQAILAQAKQWQKAPWLRPLTASLTRPDGKLLRTLTGHSDRIRAVVLTPDGQRLISGSDDNTLKVWDVETGKELCTLTGHNSPVSAVAVTPDGQRLISASNDKTLKVWDVETGKELRTLTGHSNSVSAVAVTPDGQRLISGSWDDTLKVWDVETGKELRTLTGHSERVSAVAVTPDGQRLISGSWDYTLKVWDVETGKELRTLTGHSDWVSAVAVTPDGQRLISASFDKTLKVWGVETGKELRILTGHSSAVSAVAVTPDGQRMISGSWDSTLKVWKAEIKRGFLAFYQKFIPGKLLFTLTGHSNVVQAVAVTPDGQRLISASWDKTLKVWDVKTGKELRTLTGHSNSVLAVAVTPDGQRVISGSEDYTLKVWDLETGKVIATFTGDSPIYCCAVALDGVTIVAGEQSGRMHFLAMT
ncbi:hypothetical protein NUACC21_81370 [Scytonema sp. NUACC21]